MKKYIDKRIKLREKNLKYDFLPSMVEIIERPANIMCSVILFLVIGLIITTILWASFFKIDIAVTAYGTVMPEEGVVAINSINSGKVKEICVEEGTYVQVGDPVLILDNEECELQIQDSQYNLKIVNVQLGVYRKIYESLNNEEDLDIDASNYGDDKQLVEEILLEKSIYDYEIEKTYSRKEKEQIAEEYKYKVLQKINELDLKANTLQIQLEELNVRLEQGSICATVEGEISQIKTLSPGDLISSTESFGYIIPKKKPNVFCAYVPDESIEQFQIGDEVKIKIAAYKDTQYESMNGKIDTIGDMAVNKEGYGMVYLVNIYVEDLPEEARTGLEGTCDIVIGRRTVLEYFMEPFIEGFGNSMKEK